MGSSNCTERQEQRKCRREGKQRRAQDDIEHSLAEIRDICITTNRVLFIVMIAALIFGLVLVFLPYTSAYYGKKHVRIDGMRSMNEDASLATMAPVAPT